ncbi:MAG: hypothetical protein J6Y37_13720, partial [Paludibacteraceae bacterium]|nr:hypothetical protein [Paludibacteraceae bacterium]
MKKSKFMLAALLGLYASTSLSSAAVTPTEPQKNSDGYYLISDYAELVWFRDYVNDGNISANAKLTKDINVPSGENWYPIGVVSESTDYAGYNGTFNGCGHKIDGLCAEPTLDGVVGFFYMIEEGSGQKPFIDSLHITNATYKETTGKGRLGGGIVATMDGGRILHSSFSGSIKLSNDARVGGIAGEAATGTIKYCYSNGSLDGNKSVAGIVGDLAGEVTNCYTNATLSSSLQSAP